MTSTPMIQTAGVRVTLYIYDGSNLVATEKVHPDQVDTHPAQRYFTCSTTPLVFHV